MKKLKTYLETETTKQNNNNKKNIAQCNMAIQFQ